MTRLTKYSCLLLLAVLMANGTAGAQVPKSSLAKGSGLNATTQITEADIAKISEVEISAEGSHPSESTLAPVRPVSAMFVKNNPVPKSHSGIDWWQLSKTSLVFLATEHSFRSITERQTRSNMTAQPFFRGYLSAVGNLHGFADGDEFYVNYVGHPMQGAVAGYIWQHNDRAYRAVEFGRNRPYWRAKLRGAAFSFAYSVQFEIGPLSEASIGYIQNDYPEVGFVDHVITPSVGLAWTIAEDWIDRDIVQRLEGKTSNRFIRVLLRGGLNPSRSFANIMGGNVPWHRDDRAGVFKNPESRSRPAVAESQPVSREIAGRTVPPFQFAIAPTYQKFLGNKIESSCIGAQGSGAFRIKENLQLAIEVGGCKMIGMAANTSGDSLEYVVGPRWTPQISSRWTPHFQMLIGGSKYTQERVWPDRKAQAILDAMGTNEGPKYNAYATTLDRNGVLLRLGGGTNVKLNSALSLRVIDFNYSRSFASSLNGINYANGLQVSGGFVLSMGTW